MTFHGETFPKSTSKQLKIYCFSRLEKPDGFFYAQDTKQEVLYGSS